MYEVILASYSAIRQHDTPCTSSNGTLLPDREDYSFWVTWYLNSTLTDTEFVPGMTIRTGIGTTVLKNELMSCYFSQPSDINYVAISTPLATGRWTFSVGQYNDGILKNREWTFDWNTFLLPNYPLTH